MRVDLHMVIIHDVCCAFEEPHTSVDVVLPYWFPSKPIEFSRHMLTIRVHALKQGVLVHEFDTRQSDSDHTNVMMSLSIELSDEFLFPCC